MSDWSKMDSLLVCFAWHRRHEILKMTNDSTICTTTYLVIANSSGEQIAPAPWGREVSLPQITLDQVSPATSTCYCADSWAWEANNKKSMRGWGAAHGCESLATSILHNLVMSPALLLGGLPLSSLHPPLPFPHCKQWSNPHVDCKVQRQQLVIGSCIYAYRYIILLCIFMLVSHYEGSYKRLFSYLY